MRVYRVKKASDRQTAPFGQGLASACFVSLAAKCRRPRLLILKRNLNGFSPDSRSKHPADSSSVPSESTSQLNGKSALISGFGTPAGFTKMNFCIYELPTLRVGRPEKRLAVYWAL